MFKWTFGHNYDYFIGGIIVGVLLGLWIAAIIAQYIETRKR